MTKNGTYPSKLGLGDIENITLRLLQQNCCDYCHDIALEYFTIKPGLSIIVHVFHWKPQQHPSLLV